MTFVKSVMVKGHQRKVVAGLQVLVDEDGVYHIDGDVCVLGALQSMSSSPDLFGRLTEMMVGKSLPDKATG